MNHLRRLPALGMMVLLMTTGLSSHGHGDGLDSQGGHYDGKNGTYHFHRKNPSEPKPAVTRDAQSRPTRSHTTTIEGESPSRSREPLHALRPLRLSLLPVR